jgi:hypothetical protein
MDKKSIGSVTKPALLLVVILSISALAPPAATRRSHDIYLAIRTDGRAGDGTLRNPFDASTPERFTALLRSYQPNYTFHYLSSARASPAVFRTYGWYSGRKKTAGAGCKHLGAGMDQTIIQLVGASNGPNDGVIFGSDGSGDLSAIRADGFELHDMTLDCNATAQPKWKNTPGASVTGVFTLGSNILIDHVHVKNFGTKHSGTECFPIFVLAQDLPGTFANNVVQYCYVDSPATGNLGTCTAIAVGGSANKNRPVLLNNVARYNVVDFTGSDFEIKNGPYAQVVEGNYVKGCTAGLYSEPAGVAHPVIFRNNVIDSCHLAFQGAAHVGSVMQGLLIEGNKFVDSGGGELRSDDSANHYMDVVIKNNSFIKSDGTLSSSGHALFVRSSNKVTIENNLMDNSYTPSIDVTATNATVSENRTATGTLVTLSKGGKITAQNRMLAP